MFNSISIKEGLGDCLIGAACAQEFSIKYRKLKFITSSSLKEILSTNPYFEYNDFGDADLNLKWPSQIDKNLYNLHTSQRFAQQMNFTIDPCKTVDIFINSKQIQNKNIEKYICINTLSAEPSRRFIPDKYIQLIENYCYENNYKIYWIGKNSKQEEVLDIKKCCYLLENCSLFIGPVSFQYHLAAAIKCNSILFCSYMPYYKYSHFNKTEHIFSKRDCVVRCELDENKLRNENECWQACKAIDYNEEEVKFLLKKYLK